jgi:amino acid transporter
MKKKLNLLCIMLLILMIVGMVMAGFAGVSDFKRGYEDGINESGTSAYNIIEGLVVFASFLVYIYAFACYVRFILNVNHGEVFTWTNVDLLKTVGWCIVVTTTVMCTSMSFDNIDLLDTWSDAISIITDGIFILIMAEVFSIGLKLKEEQDLTI